MKRVNRKWAPLSTPAIFSRLARAALGSALVSLSRLPVRPPTGEFPPFPMLPERGASPPFWMTEISLVFMARPLGKAVAYWFQKFPGSPLLARAVMSLWKISGNLTGLVPRKAMGPSTESLRPRRAWALFHMCVPMCTCTMRQWMGQHISYLKKKQKNMDT